MDVAPFFVLKNEHFANTHTLRNVTDMQLYITSSSPNPKYLINYC